MSLRLVSVTLAPDGSGAEGALRSVSGLVDDALIIACGAITDFAAARNHAAQVDADWLIVLDLDERLRVDDAPALRRYLKQTPHDVLRVMQADGSYSKEKLFRVPLRGQWVGPTHEAFVATGPVGDAPGVRFSELPKSAEQLQAKFSRDVAILEGYTGEHPQDPRWWYYLGDSYAGLGRDDEACGAWARCWALDGWDEEAAWAAYRIAVVKHTAGAHTQALEWCLKGMRRHPGLAELPWLAGLSCYHLGRYYHAIHWAQTAIAQQATPAGLPERIGFRHQPALREGPYDVLHWAYRQLGQPHLAPGTLPREADVRPGKQRGKRRHGARGGQ